MKKVIFLTGKDCHLCDEARSILLQLELEKLNFQEVDIYEKRSYLDKYWDKIPVLLNNNDALFWPFNLSRVKEFLTSDLKKIK